MNIINCFSPSLPSLPPLPYLYPPPSPVAMDRRRTRPGRFQGRSLQQTGQDNILDNAPGVRAELGLVDLDLRELCLARRPAQDSCDQMLHVKGTLHFNRTPPVPLRTSRVLGVGELGLPADARQSIHATPRGDDDSIRTDRVPGPRAKRCSASASSASANLSQKFRSPKCRGAWVSGTSTGAAAIGRIDDASIGVQSAPAAHT